MASFFDYEKVNNVFVRTLQDPRWNNTLKAIAAKKAIILVPHSVSLPTVDFSNEFVSCHLAIRNPKKINEMVTMNGIILVAETTSSEVRELLSISPPLTVQADSSTVFESGPYRDATSKYSAASNPFAVVKNRVQILREGEILFRLGPNQKQLVPIILIGQPLSHEGCGWSTEELAKQSALSESQKKNSGSQVPGFLNAWFGNSTPQNQGNTSETDSPSTLNNKTKSKKAKRQNMSSFKDLFWVKLKDPAAYNITQKLRNFIPDFLKHPPPASDQGKIVHNFIQELLDNMRATDLWKDASHEELDEVGYDCLEKFILVKIYPLCFAPTPEDLQKDKALSLKIKQLSWVTPDHLEIRSFHRNTSRFSTAVTELRKMDIYKSPKDKMICLLNTCKSLYYILNKASAQGHPAGADEFLPLLIYTVIRANPPRLYSNMTFIQDFRRPTSQITETGYYLTHLVSTTMFIEAVDYSQLNISQEEFNKLMSSGGGNEDSGNSGSEALVSSLEGSRGDSGKSPREELGSAASSSMRRHYSLPQSRGKTLPTSPISSPPTSRDPYLSNDSYYPSESDDFDLSIRSREEPQRNEPTFYQQIQTDLDRRRFLACNTQDLRLGDIPTLLHMFCDLVQENQALREELDKLRDQ